MPGQGWAGVSRQESDSTGASAASPLGSSLEAQELGTGTPGQLCLLVLLLEGGLLGQICLGLSPVNPSAPTPSLSPRPLRTLEPLFWPLGWLREMQP